MALNVKEQEMSSNVELGGGHQRDRATEGTAMKRRAGVAGVVAAVSLAMVLTVAWRAGDASNEQVFKTPCSCHAGNCTFIVPFPAGHFHMIR